MEARPDARKDLLAWLGHLEAAGLCRVSHRLVDECARIVTMPGAWRSPEDLADALASRLASDPRAWRAIRDHLLTFVARGVADVDAPPAPPEAPATAPERPVQRPPAAPLSERLAALLRRFNISGVAWLAVLAVLVTVAVVGGPRLVATLAKALFPPPWLDNLLAAIRGAIRPPIDPLPSERYAILPESGSLLTPLEIDVPEPPGLPGPTWLLALVLLFSVGLALLAARWWAASTAFREQLRAAEQGAEAARRVAQAESRAQAAPYHIVRHLWIGCGDLDDAATLLGRAHAGGLGDDLDVPPTLSRTIDAGGRFVPVFAPATLRPIPVVLVDTEQSGHPYLDPVEHILERWRAGGLRFDRYDFEWSPTQLVGHPDGRPITLGDLARHTEGRPLLVFSRMSQPQGYTGRIDWLHHLAAWPARAFVDLDPRPLAEHSERARRLRDQLGAVGLQRFAFTGPDLIRAARALATGEPVHPASERPLPSVAALEPALWRWAACAAIVPDPTWPQLEALRRDLPELARRLPDPRLVHRLCEWARHRHLGLDGRDYLIGDGPRLVLDSISRFDLVARLRTEDPALAAEAHRLLIRQLEAASAEGDRFGEALRQAKLDYHRAILDPGQGVGLLDHQSGVAAREVRRMVREELATQSRQVALAGDKAPVWDDATRDTLEAHVSDVPSARLLDLLLRRPLGRRRSRLLAAVAVALVGGGIAFWWGEESGRWDLIPDGPPGRDEAWISTPPAWKVTRLGPKEDLTALVDVAPMTFVALPGGEFLMGSPETEKDRNENERQHRVRVSPFAMATHEVTLAQWAAVMKTRPSDCDFGCEDKHPVQNVSWEDACRFTIALTERENQRRSAAGQAVLTPCYVPEGESCAWPEANRRCTGFRLPTEAEWEYAARAGTATAYSFGNDPNEACKYANVDNASFDCDDGSPNLALVGSFKPNDWGLRDMHGNVYEWVWDWLGDYETTSDNDSDKSDKGVSRQVTNDPRGPENGAFRVLRGGSFGVRPGWLRAAVRVWNVPSDRFGSVGFRVVRVPPSTIP